MSNWTRITILYGLMCVGCDSAAKQQQAEDERRAAAVANLKQLGEALHENQEVGSAPADMGGNTSDESERATEDQPVTLPSPESTGTTAGNAGSPASRE